MASLNKIRDAASVIVLRSQTVKKSCRPFDYELLFMKRHSKQKFMPNSYVFPGGSIDSADLERDRWQKCFLQHMSEADLENLKRSLAFPTVPKMYQNKSDSSHPMSNQMLYRVAGIREVLEETGVFISDTGAKAIPASDRRVIHKDASKFVDFCQQTNSYPDISRLTEWSIWLTPTGLDSRRRFDTMFYTLVLDEAESTDEAMFQHDEVELTSTVWGPPHQFLQNYQDYLMHPPQAFELSRMINFQKLQDLKTYSEARQKTYGTETWMPVVRQITDDSGKKLNISVMPGDYLYPLAQYESDYKVVSDEELYLPDKGRLFTKEGQYDIWKNKDSLPDGLPVNRGFWFNESTSAKNAKMKSTRILYVANTEMNLGHVNAVRFEDWPTFQT